MKIKSFITKNATISFFLLIAVSMLLSAPLVAKAEDLKTKIFYKDLKKSAKYVDDQFKALMTIFNALKPEEVELINDSMRVGTKQSVKIFNPKVDEGMKKLVKLNVYGPKGVKYGNNHSGGIPRNLLTGYVIHVGDYHEVILQTYHIPVKDHSVALERYANYLIDLLDKLQVLRAKQEEIGLNIAFFPKINGRYVSIQTPCPTLNAKNTMFDTGIHFKNNVYDNWKRSTDKWMDLYSNPNILTVQKLWFEFIITNDLSHDRSGNSFDEAYMKELEFIEQRLADVSSAPTVVAEKKDESKNNDTDISSASGTKKGNFKLELPD
jgi:hypothetical protein